MKSSSRFGQGLQKWLMGCGWNTLGTSRILALCRFKMCVDMCGGAFNILTLLVVACGCCHCRHCCQVDSFNKALQRNTTAGKLTALFKNKMLSRSNNANSSSPQSSRSPSGGGLGTCLSADEMLQWSNVSAGGWLCTHQPRMRLPLSWSAQAPGVCMQQLQERSMLVMAARLHGMRSPPLRPLFVLLS